MTIPRSLGPSTYVSKPFCPCLFLARHWKSTCLREKIGKTDMNESQDHELDYDYNWYINKRTYKDIKYIYIYKYVHTLHVYILQHTILIHITWTMMLYILRWFVYCFKPQTVVPRSQQPPLRTREGASKVADRMEDTELGPAELSSEKRVWWF